MTLSQISQGVHHTQRNHSRRSHEEVHTKERKVLDIGGSARAPAKDETERRRRDRFLPVMNITEHPHLASDWSIESHGSVILVLIFFDETRNLETDILSLWSWSSLGRWVVQLLRRPCIPLEQLTTLLRPFPSGVDRAANVAFSSSDQEYFKELFTHYDIKNWRGGNPFQTQPVKTYDQTRNMHG